MVLLCMEGFGERRKVRGTTGRHFLLAAENKILKFH